MWENHYKSLLNLPKQKAEIEAFHFVYKTLNQDDLTPYSISFNCNVKLVMDQLHKLKCKCSPGIDKICTEHLIYSHPLLHIHLSLLFNICLMHGFLPNRCIEFVIIPVIKNKKK